MMKVLCTRAVNCDSGATSIEYGLAAALVSVALFTGAGSLGDTLSTQFQTLSKTVGTAAEQKRSGRGTMLISMQGPTSEEVFVAGSLTVSPP